MVTAIGLNPDFDVVLKSLIRLDWDAVEAYEAAENRLEAPELKKKMAEFMDDHKRHIKELSALAKAKGLEVATGPDIKAILTEGKVVIADILGDDKAILLAMKSNEADTNTAYERAFNHKNLPAEAHDIVQRGYADERKHRSWIIDTIANMAAKAA